MTDDGADKEAFVRYVLSAIADRLSLVVITIDDENPYEIFESLNVKGLPLQQSDLIRNFLFMQIRREDQQDFNGEHWQAFEEMFGESGKKPIMPPTRFYRNYLMRDGEYLLKEEVYPGFKRDMKQRNATPPQAAGDLKRFLTYLLQLIDPARCEDVELRRLLEQVDQLEITTAHSLVMRLMSRHEDGDLDSDGLLKCLQMVASFVLRRSICGESTRPYSKWFVAAINPHFPDDSVRFGMQFAPTL